MGDYCPKGNKREWKTFGHLISNDIGAVTKYLDIVLENGTFIFLINTFRCNTLSLVTNFRTYFKSAKYFNKLKFELKEINVSVQLLTIFCSIIKNVVQMLLSSSLC